MKVQTKILLLLLLLVATFVGGLVGFQQSRQQKFRALAEARAAARGRMFDEFLKERGDNLKAVVDDATVWDDLVRAVVKDEVAWAGEQFDYEKLSTFKVNAFWVYRPDRRLLYSINNRYAENLKEIPVPPEAFDHLFTTTHRECHFFVRAPQGWLEIRGATIHPSRDRFRETTPQGYFFAGQFWIDENVRRMSLFTGYSIRIVPAAGTAPVPPSAEEEGRISFSRSVPGWDGNPVAQILVENNSPIIRELNRASRQLFYWLLGFAAIVFLILAGALGFWVRKPLRLISRNLERENPEALAPLCRKKNEFGRLAQLILQFRCTEQKLHQAEEELRHSQKLEAVGRLAGGVAHDFNNLLTAIIGYSQLLECKLDGESQEHATQIRKAGERAAGLTKQLLAFSRKQLLQPRVIDLNRLVRDMEKLLQRVIGEHIRIILHTEAEDARVLADPNQLEQVILNLGVNARDAMPGGGTLTLRTRNYVLSEDERRSRGDGAAPGMYVSLEVADTGLGMDDEVKSRIFEPFFTTKGPGKGTGLGLATVYGIVMQSRGHIAVESEIGKGSAFRIDLPREDAPIDPGEILLPMPDQSLEGETILVVEDEEVVRMLVCAVLEEAGYTVLCACLPSDALTLVRAHRGAIDLLLADVVMPEMNGPDLAKLLAPLQPSMQVLYVSGYSESDISDQGVAGRGLEILQKPFTQQILLRRVRQTLNNRLPAAAPVAVVAELPPM